MNEEEFKKQLESKSLDELEQLYGKTQLKDLLFVYNDPRAISYFNNNFYTCEGEDYEIPDYPDDELDDWWNLEDLIEENMSSDDIIEQLDEDEISDLIEEYTDEELIKLGMEKLIKYR